MKGVIKQHTFRVWRLKRRIAGDQPRFENHNALHQSGQSGGRLTMSNVAFYLQHNR